MNNNLQLFRKATKSNISKWTDSLVYACLYAKDNSFDEKSFKTLKDNIKDISKKAGEDWSSVSSARTKVISCAKRICLAYPLNVTTYEDLLSFLKNEKLTSQKSIEKQIDKDGKIKPPADENNNNNNNNNNNKKTISTDEERVRVLLALYDDFDLKDNFFKAVDTLRKAEKKAEKKAA